MGLKFQLLIKHFVPLTCVTVYKQFLRTSNLHFLDIMCCISQNNHDKQSERLQHFFFKLNLKNTFASIQNLDECKVNKTN